MLRVHIMKSDEKPIYVKFMQFFEKKLYMLWLTGIFLYFWRVLKIFLNPRLSLIVPLISDLQNMKVKASIIVKITMLTLLLPLVNQGLGSNELKFPKSIHDSLCIISLRSSYFQKSSAKALGFVKRNLSNRNKDVKLRFWYLLGQQLSNMSPQKWLQQKNMCKWTIKGHNETSSREKENRLQ